MMIGMRLCNLTGAGLLLLAAAALHAQHSYTAADVEDGARLYQANCFGCHGPEGNQVPGVNFSRGQFLSVKSDEDLQSVILKAFPERRCLQRLSPSSWDFQSWRTCGRCPRPASARCPMAMRGAASWCLKAKGSASIVIASACAARGLARISAISEDCAAPCS